MRITLSNWQLTLVLSLFITTLDNISFWEGMYSVTSFAESPVLFISFYIVIFTVINLLFTLISFKPIFKILASIIILTSAAAAYFMDNYSVMIDQGMIQNVLGTDVSEATELFSMRLFLTILFLGLLPVGFIYMSKIRYKPFFKSFLQNILILITCLGVIGGTLYANYPELSFFTREHRELRHLINPTNYLSSIKAIIKKKIGTRNIVTQAIEDDAYVQHPRLKKKPLLLILVLGETARAMNFSLNGYKRDTTPLLAKQDIINFSNVTSCGTATAVSVPCMFSKFSRSDYSDDKALRFENLLDVIKHAGYDILWRDNNTGCQGICKRISYEDLAHSNNPEFCEDGNCIDEILLDNLQATINKKAGDIVLILHQKGNHGPTYHKRYPENFEVFTPTCKTNQLQSCSEEEIVNAYDNAILYTDFFLDSTIEFLKTYSKKYNTAMFYMSDHGESLGENNLYLHGLPYVIAPKEQKEVPFIVWLSDEYQKVYNIKRSCVTEKTTSKFSHDNFFSSMLGLLAIKTKVYDSDLDVFSSCRTKAD